MAQEEAVGEGSDDMTTPTLLDLQAELTELAAIEAEAIGYPSHEGQVF